MTAVAAQEDLRLLELGSGLTISRSQAAMLHIAPPVLSQSPEGLLHVRNMHQDNLPDIDLQIDHFPASPDHRGPRAPDVNMRCMARLEVQ